MTILYENRTEHRSGFHAGCAFMRPVLCLMLFFGMTDISALGGTMPELTTADQMLYSTIKITVSHGDISSSGTGFFMNFAVADSGYVPTIVTNKHVVQEGNQIEILFHIEEQGRPSGKFFPCTLNILPNTIFKHPDPDVDLCAIPIGNVISHAKKIGKPIFVRSLGLDLIPKEEDWQNFDAIEDVTMIGYPRGISDEINNLPVVRRGITASSLGMQYNGKQEFMVDMACFPGSSGSPVFLYNRGIFVDRRNDRPMAGDRLYLVGILYAGPQITSSGQIVLAQPPEVVVQTMMHLGNVIKSTQLSALDAEVRRRHPAMQKSE